MNTNTQNQSKFKCVKYLRVLPTVILILFIAGKVLTVVGWGMTSIRTLPGYFITVKLLL